MTILSSDSIESALLSLEAAYAIQITIIDREGYFHDAQGRPIFGRLRHSHQSNPCCHIQFDQRCVDHCRHHCNHIGERKRRPFETTCWKGISELAIPLVLDEQHLGTLFLGQWPCSKRASRPDSKQFHKNFFKAYAALPSRSVQKLQDLKQLGPFIAQAIVQLVKTAKQLDQQEREPSRKRSIRSFLQREPGTNLELHSLAKHLHVSESRCSHLVKELFGCSLHQLIVEERIRRAKQLLHSSERSTAEIAEIIGLSDQFYFSKVFKKACGMPPGQYRKHVRDL